MGILQERFTRRRFLEGAVVGTAGLVGVAFLGRERNSPEDLVQKLLTTPLKEGDLPRGLVFKGASAADLDPTMKALEAIGVVNIAIAETNNSSAFGVIAYTVFKNGKGPRRYINATENQISPSSPNISRKNLPPYSIVGKVNYFSGPMQIAVVPVGNVLVASMHNTNGPMAVELESSAIAHLKRVR